MLVGFACPRSGQNIPFAECLDNCPHDMRCMELPLLLAMTEDVREIKPDTFSTTEILNPIQKIVLARQRDYYVCPMDRTWLLFGTAFHSIIEDQKRHLPQEYQVEHDNSFKVPVETEEGIAFLTGRPDQYHIPSGTLTDYKTAKYYYDVQYMMENKWDKLDEYAKQINIYRRHKFPNCKKMELVCLIKDYNKRLKDQGMPPIVKIAVPWVGDEEIDVFVRDKLTAILRVLHGKEQAQICSEEERWKDKRCQSYCNVNQNCAYWQGKYGANQPAQLS